MSIIQNTEIYEKCENESHEELGREEPSEDELNEDESNGEEVNESESSEDELLATSSDSNYSFYPSLLSMVADTKKYVLGLTVLFSMSIVIGYIFGMHNPSSIETIIEGFADIIIPEHTSFELMTFIFFNNLKVAAIAIFLGCFFAIIPIFMVFFNGIIIGIVAESFIREAGLLFLVVGLLPHGIIEIPMILFSAGIGCKMGVGALQVIIRKKTARSYLHDFVTATWIFVLIILPLLLAAAFIESYVTAFLLEQMF